MSIKNNKTVWIGLVSVLPNSINNVLETNNVAFVNALALADSPTSFLHEVAKELSKLNLSVIDVEDVEKLEDRLNNFEVDNNLVALAEKVCTDSIARFGNFHIF